MSVTTAIDTCDDCGATVPSSDVDACDFCDRRLCAECYETHECDDEYDDDDDEIGDDVDDDDDDEWGDDGSYEDDPE